MGKPVTMTTADYRRLRRRMDSAVQQMEALAALELGRELVVAFEELHRSGDQGWTGEDLRALQAAAKKLEEATSRHRFDLIKIKAMAGNVGNTAARMLRLSLGAGSPAR
jgi:hypothetical protein